MVVTNASDSDLIYVPLLDEGVDVWRPVRAERVSGNVFRILWRQEKSENEHWQFGPGDEVVCSDLTLSDGTVRAAIRLASDTAPLVNRGDVVEVRAVERRELAAVTFVRDYVQLQFDGPTITAVTLPSVCNSGKVFASGSPGWRDQLCGRIGKRVSRAIARAGVCLQIDFIDGSSIAISLRPEDTRGAESAIFDDRETKTLATW